MTTFETCLFGVGFIALFAVVLCIIGTIADEWENIPRMVRKFWHRACDWLFDVQTAYWKFRAHRRHKRGVW